MFITISNGFHVMVWHLEAADGNGSNVFIKALKTVNKRQSYNHESGSTVKFALMIFSSARACSTGMLYGVIEGSELTLWVNFLGPCKKPHSYKLDE